MPKYPIHIADKRESKVLLPSGLKDEAIINFSSYQSFNRGRSYVKNGFVKGFIWNPIEKSIEGTVRGSGNNRYECGVIIDFDSGAIKLSDSYCECPVGYACKHCVAILLAGRKLVTKMTSSVLESGDASDLEESEMYEADENWEFLLQEIFASNRALLPKAYTEIALQFEILPVRKLTNQSFYFDDTPYELQDCLGIRIINKKFGSNKWLSTGLIWKDIQENSFFEPEYKPDQIDFLKDFQRLAKPKQKYYSYDDTKYILLDTVESSFVYGLLMMAKELGVELIAKQKQFYSNKIVFENTPAVLYIGLKQDDDITLIDPELLFLDKLLSSDDYKFVGNYASAIYQTRRSTGVHVDENQDWGIRFIPLENPVNSVMQEFLDINNMLVVPRGEKHIFDHQYLNRITKEFNVVSLGGTIDIPKNIDPVLSIKIEYLNSNKIQVLPSWQYISGVPNRNSEFYDFHSVNPGHLRNLVLEQKLMFDVVEKLGDLFNQDLLNQIFDNNSEPNPSITNSSLITYLVRILPILKEVQNVLVEEVGDLEFLQILEKPEIEIGTSRNSEAVGDWFNLDISVKVGDNDIELSDLISALSMNEEYMILENGTYFSLDSEILQNLKKLIDEAKDLQEKKSDTLQINRYHASFWEELKALGIIRDQANEWQKSIDGLLNLKEIKALDAPEGLNAKLRPYQLEGYQWLSFLYENKLGAILGDDMGLGKTVQALAMIVKVFENIPKAKRKPFLVVAPSSVATNWLSESRKFAPNLKTVLITQTSKKSGKALLEEIKGADIVITSYTLMRIDFEAYSDTKTIEWAGMFLDEAQFIKNHQSKSYQCARKLNMPFKLAMTGTPIENNLMELWSLFSVTSPGLFGGPKKFTDVYRKPIEKDQDKEKLEQIRRRVKPLLLRRTKEQVVKELPPKIEQVLELQMNDDHKKVYDLVLARERQKVLGLIDDVDKNQFTILKSLTTLRMLSLDPSLVDPEKYAHVSSTKLDALVDQIKEVVGENHRALIFSQFTSFLAKVKERLDDEGIKYSYLDGKTKNRGDVIEKFKTSDIPLFLISLKSGGFGLNLTEADYCFLLDPWWNPAAEAQAIDRTHRIGQKKQVMVYRLVSKDTIEEKVMQLKERKAKLFKSVLDEGEIFSAKLTAEDVKSLFE